MKEPGEEHSGQREQQVQRPWGQIRPGMVEEDRGVELREQGRENWRNEARKAVGPAEAGTRGPRKDWPVL